MMRYFVLLALLAGGFVVSFSVAMAAPAIQEIDLQEMEQLRLRVQILEKEVVRYRSNKPGHACLFVPPVPTCVLEAHPQGPIPECGTVGAGDICTLPILRFPSPAKAN